MYSPRVSTPPFAIHLSVLPLSYLTHLSRMRTHTHIHTYIHTSELRDTNIGMIDDEEETLRKEALVQSLSAKMKAKGKGKGGLHGLGKQKAAAVAITYTNASAAVGLTRRGANAKLNAMQVSITQTARHIYLISHQSHLSACNGSNDDDDDDDDDDDYVWFSRRWICASPCVAASVQGIYSQRR